MGAHLRDSNCLDGTPHYYEWEGWSDPQHPLTQRWLPTVKHHVAYKWIWLNISPAGRERGAGAMEPGKVETETVRDVTFADELFVGSFADSRSR